MTFTLYQPVASAYVGLKQGGELALVRDQAMRREIVNYYEVRQPYMLQFAALVHDAHWALRIIVQDHLGFVVTDSTQSFWPPRPQEFATSWSALSSAPETRGALEYVGTLGGNWSARIESVLEANSDLRKELASRIAEAL